MANTTSLSRTQRKLETLELKHLRQHAATQQSLLELAEANYRNAEESAEFWQRHAMQLQEALHDDKFATHRAVGITKTGETMVIALS